MPGPLRVWPKASSGVFGGSQHPAISAIQDSTDAAHAFNRLLDTAVGHISPQDFGALAEEHIGPGTGDHFTSELANRSYQIGRQEAHNSIDQIHEHLSPTMAHFMEEAIRGSPESLNPSDASGSGGSSGSSSSGGSSGGGGGGGTSSGGGPAGVGVAPSLGMDPAQGAGFSVGTGLGQVAAALGGAMFSGQAGAIGLGPGQAFSTEADMGVDQSSAHGQAVAAAVAEAFGGPTAAVDPAETEAGPAGLGGDPGTDSSVSDASSSGSDSGGDGGDSGD